MKSRFYIKIAAVTLLAMSVLSARSQVYIRIHRAGQDILEYPIESIDSISFGASSSQGGTGTLPTVPPNDEIWYTSTDGGIVIPHNVSTFGAKIVSITYNDGKGVIKFDGDVTNVGDDTTIGSDLGAFSGNSTLESIILPQSVRYVSSYAFWSCFGLKNVQLPDSLEYLGEIIFGGSDVKELYIPVCRYLVANLCYSDSLQRYTGPYASTDGISLIQGTKLVSIARAGVRSYVIPDGVTELGTRAFYYLQLDSIIIPSSVTKIGTQTFFGNDSLKRLVVPENVESIENFAFADCNNLEYIVFKPTTPPVMLTNNLDRTNNCPIYVPSESVAAYKAAPNWNVYADRIMAIPQDTADVHEYVDLGLSVMWATCNVGADSPEEGGDRFAWGETETKTTYNYMTSKWYDYESERFLKYNLYQDLGVADMKYMLDPEDDAAHVNWGDSWRTPSPQETAELKNNCNWVWTELNGTTGYMVTSKINGNSIFLPSGSYGSPAGANYLTNSLNTHTDGMPPYALQINSSGYIETSTGGRYDGCYVRPVYSSEFKNNVLSITGLSLDKQNVTVNIGQEADIIASLQGASVYDYAPKWYTDDPEIAVVSSSYSGNVLGISEGQCVITASIGPYTQQCTVTVSKVDDIKEYVDLGLSVKWATCNIGASQPEYHGAMFAWGETESKTSYDWDNYRWAVSTFISQTKYCTDSYYGNQGFVDDITELELEDDVAHAVWGGSWRMPTSTEFEELIDSCTWEQTRQNGIYGYKVTSKVQGYTDNYIFLPITGYCTGDRYQSYYYSYWSSSLDESEPYMSKRLYLGSGTPIIASSDREYGITVRPVYDENIIPSGPPVDEIWYSTTDGNPMDPAHTDVFGATLLSNTYQDGKGVMKFDTSVLEIGRYAFNGCSKLASITIPSGVTSIGWCAFRECTRLSSITIPDNVTEVDVASFMDCSSLTSIVLPDKVRGLDNQVFMGCTKLSSIQFSDSITYIAHWVFESTPITSIVIPATVSSIAWGSIADCNNLTSVTVDARNTYYDSRGNCNAIIHTATNTLISGCATTVIPQDVTALYDYSFYCCDRLKTITIPEGVETIGRQAFQSCDSLKTLIVPSTVTDIGLGAFGYCPQMTSIVFLSTTPPTAGDGILDYSNNCPIYVPEGSVAAYKEAENWSVYANRIMAIPGETANHQPGNEIWYTSTDGAVVAPNDASVFGATLLSNTYQKGKGVMTFDGFVTQVGRDAFNGCSKLVTVDLPSGVAEIGWCAFRGCSNLSSISIPDGVSSIFVGAFMECTSLTSITFPDAVRSLNNQVFYGCTNLSSIHFSDSITYIAHWVFENTPISSIVIPATVSQIDWGSIAGCRNLTSVSVDPRNTYYDSRGNCNAIIRTATNTLISGCAITVIPQDVTALYDYAFMSCTGLDTITIPEGVTTIGRQVFQGCSNLSSITIPSTVQTMGQSVFNACQNLSFVKVLATVPPTIGETVFSTYNNCPIYVPAESLQEYKSAENWSVYADRIQAIP